MLTSIKKICENISGEIGVTPTKKAVQLDELPDLSNAIKLKCDNQNSLICIGSRPGMGKTSLALDFVLDKAINSKKEILIFSLDMSAKQIVSRLIQKLSGVNLYMFRDCVIKETDKNKVSSALAFLQKLDILIDDSPANTPDYVEKCLQDCENAGFVMIDYIQLIQFQEKRKSCQQELFRISEEYHVTMLVLTQLAINSFSNIDDILSTDYLMLNSDTVLIINRNTSNDNALTDNDIEIICHKSNIGEISIINMGFDDNTISFKEYA